MNPPTVLLDATFLHSLLHPNDERHTDARRTYQHLVDQFRTEQAILVATNVALRAIERTIRRTVLAPVDSVHMAGRYRSAGRRVHHYGAADPEFAALLVLLRRERIDQVASYDPRLAGHGVSLVQPPPAADDRAADSGEQPADLV